MSGEEYLKFELFFHSYPLKKREVRQASVFGLVTLSDWSLQLWAQLKQLHNCDDQSCLQTKTMLLQNDILIKVVFLIKWVQINYPGCTPILHLLLATISIQLAPRAGKMNRISRLGWLPERTGWSYLARSGSQPKNFANIQPSWPHAWSITHNDWWLWHNFTDDTVALSAVGYLLFFFLFRKCDWISIIIVGEAKLWEIKRPSPNRL